MKNTTKTSPVKRQKMKLSGSFFNYLMGNNASVPVVGQGATIMSYSDRDVAEVLEVSPDGKTVIIEMLNTEADASLSPSGTLPMGQQCWKHSPSGNKGTLVWYRGAWRTVHTEIVFTEQFKQECFLAEGETYISLHRYLTPKQKFEIYQGEIFPQKVVPGITKAKKTYNKINILFGEKNYYYDWSF